MRNHIPQHELLSPQHHRRLQTIAGNEDISTALTLPILGVPDRDCGVDPCAVVYRGSGTAIRPVTEFLSQSVTFTPRSAIISIDGNVETVVGNNINVVWQALHADQIPTDRTIEAPKNYVGICLGDADPLQSFSDRDCEGVDLGPDATFEELDITATRSITTGREGTVDCVSYAAGCVVGYSLSYVDLEGVPFAVVLDRDSRPLTFARSVNINNGSPNAEPGALIGVSVQGVPVGPAGFVMMCAIGDQGGLDLRCSSDIGTVEAPFDGDFIGSITMPTSIDAGGDTFDCRLGRGCLVVFAVIDNDLKPLFGRGHWVRGS